ncbi:NADPH-dependent ferric siderophore reductase, contains FAD-binding and SIP domains [Streptoalloteichus tenebrarius]|uniref:NADPH-dependent ferric siderophore reductase, contains FAD-binding and SIP domains n=1 Tax=Streptoalloteichus tenebrarius (strain ATCC 17920 / DSM 40477 / JCM 4838 / CBS 697.72 / NBRC 16177 / NCIMB 11028 / NRRL B-12390 / A12253. 1 / ISP 5477) TaxID=1933 RepID=A0ABT1HNW2_STRSD|nr:SIP domain-containing protein [Streptoalloteichus tenebrarius]MCP2257202.1 NADPH-dependent ferric siderophore reductase, contains FAD-binding and SIP domains [Streptoalloteichus tenebrarius]BFE98837.1 hypothetical protein GCM10020241_05130 [Streptoalloteichus tenebrarius]
MTERGVHDSTHAQNRDKGQNDAQGRDQDQDHDPDHDEDENHDQGQNQGRDQGQNNGQRHDPGPVQNQGRDENRDRDRNQGRDENHDRDENQNLDQGQNQNQNPYQDREKDSAMTERTSTPVAEFGEEIRRRMAEIKTYVAPVLRVDQLTPRMTRVRVGGPELAGFAGGQQADEHIKLIFPAPGRSVPVLPTFTLDGLRYPEGVTPSHARSYTVRRYNPLTEELDVDFVIHGHGRASEWARSVKPGDRLGIAGPKGGFLPSPDVDLHLMVGDESALPAIATILEHMRPDVPVRVIVEVADRDEEQELRTEAAVQIDWLHRESAGTPSLTEAVRAMAWPSGLVSAWVAGEAGMVRDLRRHLLRERGVERRFLRATGYWRQGRTTDEWAAEDMVKLRAALAAGKVTEAQILNGDVDLDD